MLQIGCPKAKLLKEKIDQLDFESIQFEVVRLSGLTLQVKHTAASDEAAKAAMKKYIKTIPELANLYTNIQLIDAQGRIL